MRVSRNAALAITLAAFGLFVLQLLFKSGIWEWRWLPSALKLNISNGRGEAAALIVTLGAAYWWLRPSAQR